MVSRYDEQRGANIGTGRRAPAIQPRRATDDDDDLAELARQRVRDAVRTDVAQQNDAPQTGSAAAAREAARKAKAAAKAKAGLDDDDLALNDLARLRADQQKERAAVKAEQEASRARTQQGIDARAGLSGMGLSGATSALKGDAERVAIRSDTLANSELARRQRDEQFLAAQRDILLRDLEIADNFDHDGDGRVGGRDGTSAEDARRENEIAQGAPKRQEFVDQAGLKGVDHSLFDADTEPGSREEPFSLKVDQRARAEALGIEFKQVGTVGLNKMPLYVDQDGRFYVFDKYMNSDGSVADYE